MGQDEVTRYYISILDTRPGGQAHGIMVVERKDVESKILHDDFFDDLPMGKIPELSRVARKVKQGHIVEFPKGVFIGLSSQIFDRNDVIGLFGPEKEKVQKEKKKAPKTPTKKTFTKKSEVSKTTPKTRSKNPKVSKTSKGVFLVENPSDTHLKKLRKGVKNIDGSVRKVPSKDNYVVTIAKGGTIKGLKEIMAG